MVPVRVADQEVAAQPICVARHQLSTKRTRPGSAVDDDQRSPCRAHFDTRSIPSISRCSRAASSPELYPHAASASRFAGLVCSTADTRGGNSSEDRIVPGIGGRGLQQYEAISRVNALFHILPCPQ